MNAIKLGFKLLGTKSPFEKDIIKVLCSPDLNAPPEKLATSVFNALTGTESNPATKSNTKIFFDSLKSTKRWEEAAKLLIIAHQVLANETSGFINEFSINNIQNILDLPNSQDEFRHYVRCGLIKYYYRYLKKLSESYFSVRKCLKYTSTDYANVSKKNDSQIILHFVQLKELVSFLAKVEDFYVSSVELQDVPVMLMIGELMLRDCIKFYNLLRNFITSTIENIFEMQDETALLLDGLYSDLIRLQKPVESFNCLRRTFSGRFATEEPNYYIFDREFNKKEELHMFSIRKRSKEAKKEMNSHYMQTMPDRPSDFYRLDDDLDIEAYNNLDSERKEDDTAGLVKNNKKQMTLERQALITSEDKDYFDDNTHTAGKQRKSGTISLNSIITPKQGTGRLIQFSKIGNTDK